MDATFSIYRKIDDCPSVAVHGQVHTKPHIVELMLDLAGYLGQSSATLLDPGCGYGAFIIAAARRLIARHGSKLGFEGVADSLLGIEKDGDAVAICRERMRAELVACGVSTRLATRLAERWIVQGDFLDGALARRFDFVVGNPPYVRQEAIPKKSLERYRSEFKCFYDRADLYVAFFEQGLNLLGPSGVLSFICPDRFTRNNYGKKLRGLIAEQFGVRYVLDLAQASPFEPEVASYPGIFIIARGSTGAVDHFRLTEGSPDECESIRQLVSSELQAPRNGHGPTHHRYESWFSGEQQWSVESPAHLKLMRRLESEGVPLGSESSGCWVRIGVATGADDVFIVPREFDDVERELLMPLVTTGDIGSGQVEWSGRSVINPFVGESGELIDLRKFPRARDYFGRFRHRLEGRNVGQRDLRRWYRTIDRIYPSLQKKAKLLIPDIKAENLIALESGGLYPHHNLYFVVSEYWDLRALRTILRSSLGKFFVWMYGVKMRGDFLRFQAQYLRRICIPPLMEVRKAVLRRLIAVEDETNQDQIDAAVAELYSLSDEELQLIRGVAAPRRQS